MGPGWRGIAGAAKIAAMPVTGRVRVPHGGLP